MQESAARILPVDEMLVHARSAAGLLKAMANEQRLLILCHLAEGELPVGELNERLPLSQSSLSQHLAVLRRHRVVTTRREAQLIHYRLADGPVMELMGVLHQHFCGSADQRRGGVAHASSRR